VVNCRKAAEAFEVPILEAFVAAGYLTAEEAGQVPSREATTELEQSDVLELVDELRRRIVEYKQLLQRPETEGQAENAPSSPRFSGQWDVRIPGVNPDVPESHIRKVK
jgi:hypothetical protein